MSPRATVRRTTVAAVLLSGSLAVAACGSAAAADAAQAAYDECHPQEAETDIMRVDGPSVTLEISGEAARAAAESGQNLDDGLGENDLDESIDGFGIMLAVVFQGECLVDATGYPGTLDQLRDGEEWEGWRYTETSGPGAEATMTFTSTA